MGWPGCPAELQLCNGHCVNLRHLSRLLSIHLPSYSSFLAGSLPLSFGLSQNHSRVIHAIGTGLLVGTCLIIIIPEGIDTLYEAAVSSEVDLSSANGNLADGSRKRAEHAHGHAWEPHAFVGISLVAGFIMMYLIDQVPKHAASTDTQRPLHISLANLSQGPHRASSPSRFEEETEEGLQERHAAPQSMATTIGLVIHAAADGIALAASSFISQSSVGFIVFLALMIHKAPAAFGLTSVLLKQGFSKKQARAHLVVFSLAAPVGAFATWALVNLIAGGRIEGGEETEFWTGLILLFSGGTFL